MATKTNRFNISTEFLLVLFILCPGLAWAQTQFYQGKTITIVQGRDPGGTGDMRVRAMLPFLQKYIPGNPTIVNEYVPGGGSRKAANHVYRSARPDGLTIGNLGLGMISSALLGETGVLYDVDKFFYLGSPFSSHHAIFVTRKDAGLSSIEKLRSASGIRIGGQSVGFSTYIEGRLFAYIIGLKEPRFVTGYGGAELDPALIRGEIDARATSADTVVQRNPEWLEKKLVDFHAFIEVPKRGKTCPLPSCAGARELCEIGKRPQNNDAAARLQGCRPALRSPSRHAEGSRRDYSGRVPQDIQGSGVSQGIQKIYRRRSYAADARGA